ncbi:hypothetical protein F4824DRAFT_54774 [Ustulina deusta]|nr:hypothetical protein F4824DRAFT_54774 [Ustulina deusta]
MIVSESCKLFVQVVLLFSEANCTCNFHLCKTHDTDTYGGQPCRVVPHCPRWVVGNLYCLVLGCRKDGEPTLLPLCTNGYL